MGFTPLFDGEVSHLFLYYCDGMDSMFQHLRSVLEFCAIERENITVKKIVNRFKIEKRVAFGILNNLAEYKFIEKSGLSRYRFVGNDLKNRSISQILEIVG